MMLKGSNFRFRILRSFAVFAAQDDGTVHSSVNGASRLPQAHPDDFSRSA